LTDVRIRAARRADWKQLSELYYQLYPKRRSKRAVPVSRSKIANILLVAEENGKLIGFLWANLVTHGFLRFGNIEELFVKRAFRHKGVGRSLAEAAMRRFRELQADVVFVSTGRNNKRAMKFYRRLGFRLCKGPWFYWTPKRNQT
jgi:ribosomal protein S18 acetylase RimI-like enzyme